MPGLFNRGYNTPSMGKVKVNKSNLKFLLITFIFFTSDNITAVFDKTFDISNIIDKA